MPNRPRSTLVVSPHPDDAVFSAWHIVDGPGEVRVVNVFTAPPPAGAPARWDRITAARDARERMSERIEEDRRALALAGCEATCLDFLDSQYREGRQDVDALAAALAALAEGARVFAPAGIGGHSDHVAVRDATLLLTVSRGIDAGFYADFPYAAEFGWPASITGGPSEPFVDPEADWAETVAPLKEAGFEPAAVELDPAMQRRKVEAMRAYATQFAALEGGARRRLTQPELVRYEVIFEKRTA